MNKLILQIIISEILDEINILLAIGTDSFKKKNFSNYGDRMYLCYTQLFLGVFTCLWTLISSLFISVKLYDIIIKQNKIFKKGSFLEKYTHILTVASSCFISYIFWSFQVISEADELRDRSYEVFYNPPQRQDKTHFRHMYCFCGGLQLIFLAFVCGCLIIGSFYFSLRGAIKIIKTKKEFIDQNDETKNSIQKSVKKMNTIEFSLFIYPLSSAVLWTGFFILQFNFEYNFRKKESRESDTHNTLNIIYCSLISSRELIYTIVYLLTHAQLKKYTMKILTCKICKEKRKKNIKVSSLSEKSILGVSLSDDNKLINDINSDKLQ